MQSWLDGYTSVRPLSEADIAIIPTFIMVRRLLLTAWMECRKETEYAAQIREQYVAGSIRLAQSFVAGKLFSELEAA